MNLWELRMAHDKAWRDAGVETGCRTPPKHPDPPGGLALAGPVRKLCPMLTGAFRRRGHTSLNFEECQCRATNNSNPVEWLIAYRKEHEQARVVVFVSEGHGKPYKAISPLIKAPVWHGTEMATTIERDLNEGLLCHDAEVEWPKQGLHDKPTYKAHLISKLQLLKKYAHLKDVENDNIPQSWRKLFPPNASGRASGHTPA